MSLPRRLEAEWLDHLPPGDSRAIRSRRDLRRINAVMLHAGIVVRLLTRHVAGTPRAILDLGSGDGTFMLAVARRLAPRWRDVTVMLLDRQGIPSEKTRADFAALGWRAEPVSADVFDFFDRSPDAAADIVTANLFLHHFEPAPLAQLLAKAAQRIRLFVACEPRRATFPLISSKLLWALGCNDVTRHDAVVSVHAGFRGRELSELWPANGNWTLQERPAGLFSHCFIAQATGTNPP